MLNWPQFEVGRRRTTPFINHLAATSNLFMYVPERVCIFVITLAICMIMTDPIAHTAF